MQTQGVSWGVTWRIKQHRRQHGALNWLHCLPAPQTYSQPARLSPHVTPVWMFPDWPALVTPSLGPLNSQGRPFSHCLILTLPCLPFISLDPPGVCPLCAQHSPEGVTPCRCGTCVCVTSIALVWGGSCEWHWWEWRGGERCHRDCEGNLWKVMKKHRARKKFPKMYFWVLWTDLEGQVRRGRRFLNRTAGLWGDSWTSVQKCFQGGWNARLPKLKHGLSVYLDLFIFQLGFIHPPPKIRDKNKKVIITLYKFLLHNWFYM